MSKKKTRHLIAGYAGKQNTLLVIDKEKFTFVWALDTVKESVDFLERGQGIAIKDNIVLSELISYINVPVII